MHLVVVGAEHRARLIESVFAPMLEGDTSPDPAATFERLTRATAVLAIQSAEPGPIAQCIAGIDIALWDLAARRAGKPLWRMLGGTDPAVKVYASGLNPDGPEVLAARRMAEGHTAFKLKIGFGADRDLANLRAMRATVGEGASSSTVRPRSMPAAGSQNTRANVLVASRSTRLTVPTASPCG